VTRLRNLPGDVPPVTLVVSPMTPDAQVVAPAAADVGVPIIYMPHLLGIRERIGALLFSMICWLYFLVPVAILGGWLAGFSKLAHEVILLGGWKRFQHLMEWSGRTLVVLVALWLAWTLYLLLAPRKADTQPGPVDDDALCRFFGVDPGDLDRFRHAKLTTIHFDDDGSLRKLEASVPAPPPPPTIH
jgi:poly-beta-1,6-N-acetyl-D-glucosamine biosynthesis protein PgaD